MSEIPDDIAIAAEQAFEAILNKAYKEEGFSNHYRLIGKTAREIIANAILAERTRIASSLFNRPAFMLAVAGDGKPYVKIEFGTLEEMQDLHGALVELSKHKASA